MIIHGPAARRRARKKYRKAKAKLKRKQGNWLRRYREGSSAVNERQAGLSDYCSKDKFAYASAMRRDMTASERVFWELATPKRLGFKLHPQVVVLGYIVDFYCFDQKIAVEIDGSVHQSPEQMIWDATRDEAMREAGILVMRFRATTDEQKVLGQLFRLREAFLRRSGKVSPTQT